MVIYTGTDTKLALNQGKYISKISNISWQLNIYFAINIAVMLVMAAMMAFVGNVTWNKNTGVKHYYVFDEAEGPIDYGKYSGTAFMSFYLLFCNILPLDMAITLMLSKLLLVQIVQADWHMVDFERSCQEGDLIGCAVKNLTMLEDFAQINHLFCDKTGTLTKNELVFKVMAVGTHTFTTVEDDTRFAKFSQKIKNHTEIDE
jgi:magnesium-transporting ATPase (P-type)